MQTKHIFFALIRLYVIFNVQWSVLSAPYHHHSISLSVTVGFLRNNNSTVPCKILFKYYHFLANSVLITINKRNRI